MKHVADEFIFNAIETDRVATEIGRDVLIALERGLAQLGFQTVPDGSFGTLTLRVVDQRHVGTAYLEFKDGTLQMRILLVWDRAPESSEPASLGEGGTSITPRAHIPRTRNMLPRSTGAPGSAVSDGCKFRTSNGTIASTEQNESDR